MEHSVVLVQEFPARRSWFQGDWYQRLTDSDYWNIKSLSNSIFSNSDHSLSRQKCQCSIYWRGSTDTVSATTELLKWNRQTEGQTPDRRFTLPIMDAPSVIIRHFMLKLHWFSLLWICCTTVD